MNLDRRSFLGLALLGAVMPKRILAAAERLPVLDRRMLQMNAYATDAETPLDALTTYLTPNDLFFVRSHWIPVMPDPATWALTVDGEVTTPLRLSLTELKGMPKTTATCVLQCAGNGRALYRPIVPGVQWKYGAVGNARWTGVRVKDVLERAGVRGTGRHLHTYGTDTPPGKVPPFHRSVEMEKVMSEGIIAYEMNGEPLPALHGGPARLVVPGWAGDHWMKWVARLSPQPQPQTGFYVDVAYRYPNEPGEPGVPKKPDEMHPVTELFVKSNITQAPSKVRMGSTAKIRGFALSGAPDIANVELGTDGERWEPARLLPDHDPYAWRLWEYEWRPAHPGANTLFVRATDSKGSVQPREPVWNQSGYLYNGWHSVTIEVTA
jgi:DMSO/TMAO reductase YedYZ molybdopterin-dependent catalytic subunit